jgi:hypothetical protein
VKSRLFTVGLVLGALALAGWLLGPVGQPVWAAARGRQPALRLDSSLTAAGQGVTLALLGGFRALVADVTWVRMYTLWERRDLPATETLVRLVAALDPRPVYFWLNGARIVAFDFPVWRIEAAGGFERVPRLEQDRIAREQAEAGLQLLGRAMAFHPASPDLWIERANIQYNRLRDLEGAAESYRRAWELPGAPYYVARVRAEMLRRSGHQAEALAWLVQLHPTLPAGDEGAAADVVLARIRDLERELRIPPEQCYLPGR